MDEIVFDYNNRPLETETDSILQYIATMVRAVKDRAEQTTFDRSNQFVFTMMPELWEALSSLYTCSLPDKMKGTALFEEIAARWARPKAKRSIFVDGVEYSVVLDKSCGYDIYFTPQEKQSALRRYLTAILRAVVPQAGDGVMDAKRPTGVIIRDPGIKRVRAEIFRLAKRAPDLDTMRWYMWLDECFENDEFHKGDFASVQWRASALVDKDEPVGWLLHMITPILIEAGCIEGDRK